MKPRKQKEEQLWCYLQAIVTSRTAHVKERDLEQDLSWELELCCWENLASKVWDHIKETDL